MIRRLTSPRALELGALLVIIVVALVLRLYRLPELLVLGNDQGRDALVVSQMLQTRVPVTEGPIASVGTYHRGPAYYYLLAPAYALTLGHPIGGALLSVVFDVAALVMLYVLTRALAGPIAGLTAAGLWSVAPVLVEFGRFQWNPQVMPFFALLAVYAALRLARGDARWLMVLVPSFLIAWQIHDPSLFLVPLLLLVVLWKRQVVTRQIAYRALALGALVTLPFWFEQLTHGMRDVIAMALYAVGTLTGLGIEPAVASPIDRVALALSGLERSLPGPDPVQLALVALAIVGLAWGGWQLVRHRSPEGAIVLGVAFVPLMFAFWRAPLHGHYLVIAYPIPLFLAAIGVGAIARHVALKTVAVVALATLVGGSAVGQLGAIAAREPASNRWDHRLAVVHDILDEADGQPFAFVLESAQEPRDGWQAPWQYAFRYSGSGPNAIRVDLPTYVVFEPADFEGGATYGGQLTEDVRWVGLPPPQVGPDIDTDLWTFSGAATGSTGGPEEFMTIAPRWPWSYVDASQQIAIKPGTAYQLRFEFRANLLIGSVFAFAQTRNAEGRLRNIFPNGGGLIVDRPSDWTVGSFLFTTTDDAASATVILRARGAGNASFRNVSLAEVMADAVPR
jgi:4-amino-4-deoxy-L-arabinose transferase-like glycosyltransferase